MIKLNTTIQKSDKLLALFDSTVTGVQSLLKLKLYVFWRKYPVTNTPVTVFILVNIMLTLH